MPQSPSRQAPWGLTQFSQSPSAALSYFPEFHQCSESSSLSKGNSFLALFLGKPRSRRTPNLGCRGAESSGLFDVLLKSSARNMMHEYACCCDEGANHQLHTSQVWPSESLEQFPWRMFKLNAKSDTDSWLYLLSHFECDGHIGHMLTQQRLPPPLTSAVKSSLFMHAHSSPFSLAARLHHCCANCSHHIYNGLTFSRQTLYITKEEVEITAISSELREYSQTC